MQANAMSGETERESSMANYSQVGQALSKIYTAKEHGGHNQNWTSIQSEDGLIYVGHTTGVSQWDGENWLNFTTPHATPVRSIAQFKEKLYFGTTDNIYSLSLNAAGEMLADSLVSHLASDVNDFGEVWSTAANQQGVIFSAAQHTFFYDGESLHNLAQAISSKHAIFNVNEAFIYKPRHLPHLYQLKVLQTGSSLSYENNKTLIALPADARVMEIIGNSDTNMLIFTERHGVFNVKDSIVTQALRPEQFAEDVQIYDAVLASDGYYYVSSTYSGLFILDKNLQIVRHYTEADGISMNTVFSVNEDKQGNIWLTGIPNVVTIRPPHLISQYKAGNTSTEILRLANTSLGIFASGNGQFALNMPLKPSETPRFTSMSSNIESSVDLIASDTSLIKSGYGGVYELELEAGGTRIARETKLIETALGRPLVRDLNGRIIVSSSSGAFILQGRSGDWNVTPISSVNKALVSAKRDSDDTLWLGSPTGELFRLENISQQVRHSDTVIFTQKEGLGLGPVSIFNIDGQAIFASAGKLFRFIEGKLEPVSNLASTLPLFDEAWLTDSRVIDSLIQTGDMSGTEQRVWYRKNGRSGYFEKNSRGDWTEHTALFDSLQDGGFSDLFVTENNIVWFVRDKAEIYRVDIEATKKLPALGSLNIRRLQVNETALEFALGEKTPTILAPNQNSVRFSYASTDSTSPSSTRYRSRLVTKQGTSWPAWSTETYRDFTQLAAGTYTFEVESIDAWQRTAFASTRFVVLAPWYLSSAALVVYVIFGVFIFLLFAYVVQRWRTQSLEAANLVLENKVTERTREVNEKVALLKQQQLLKDRFFGNVSHEFRTPLTLTIGPLETLLSEHQSELSSRVSNLAKTALNNASKMLALVGQVLDLNRLEAGKLPLRIAQYDIAELLRNIGSRFEAWAAQHKQVIQVEHCDEPLLLWFDMDQIDKCVSNLLSNAIKYSGESTTICIDLVKHKDHVAITVSDNGVGISDAAKDKVFERFYQDKSSESIAAPGTGIGLALVKEIMDIHHGDASLVKTLAPGCCFLLSLQLGNEHFKDEQIIEAIDVAQRQGDPLSEQTAVSDLMTTPAEILAQSIDQQDVTTLLIVDDNIELLNFISLRLSASFRIIQALNGEEGYQKACEALPDLIISDVNMPIMTGLELAEKIKANPLTQTIPIILLTAKATKREVVTGFSVGADDYLTKPFDTSELIMRVNAQINARKLVRETYLARARLREPQHAQDSFKTHVTELIERELAEPSFNVEQLATLLHMSRDTLIRKCKKECADTPLNLIVHCRMHKADVLLQQQTMSVSEVAYACGFESLAYFSKSYKKHRGISPSAVTAQK